MLILGLGCNLGDKLANLRNALQQIKKIPGLTVQQVSPVYISDALMPDNAPADWNIPHTNAALRCETKIQPLDLLKQLKNIEWSIGGKPEARHWGPRFMDIDILAWDDVIIHSDELTLPHTGLVERPFALWPLADVAPFWIYPLPGVNQGKTAAQLVEKWGSRFSCTAPLHTRQIYQRIDTPQLVGIINATPDSFSDGGHFLDVDKALQQALHLVHSGADIIDIGAESTQPLAKAITSEIEWNRIKDILTGVLALKNDFLIPPKICVDTRHPDIAARVLELGVDWVNDQTGGDNPIMCNLLAKTKVDYVVMHHLSIPECRDNILPRDQDPVSLVYAWGEKRLQELEQLGIARERIIFDPGIGFGKMAEQSWAILRNVDVFKKLGTRIMIGHSRKSYLSVLTSHSFAERDIETLVGTLYLAQHAVDYIRVHNVEVCARGLRVAAVL